MKLEDGSQNAYLVNADIELHLMLLLFLAAALPLRPNVEKPENVPESSQVTHAFWCFPILVSQHLCSTTTPALCPVC